MIKYKKCSIIRTWFILHLFVFCTLNNKLNAQTKVINCTTADSIDEIGCGLCRFSNDSIVFLSSFNIPTDNTTGFDIFKSSLNLDLLPLNRYISNKIIATQINLIDGQYILVTGSRRDTIPMVLGGFSVVNGLSLIKLNLTGDTIWSNSYVSTDTIKGINLKYAGKTSDTLVFYGQIGFEDNFINVCGYIMYINNQDGSIISAKSYCDSTFSGKFQTAVLDSAKRIIHVAGTRLAKDNSSFEQVFYSELGLDGTTQLGYFVSDTSDATYGCLVKNPHDNSIILGYRTQKYNQVLNSSDLELVRFDSSANLRSCKYNPNFSSGNPQIFSGEIIDSLAYFRLWSENFFIDVDSSLNYQNGKWVNFNLPLDYYGCSYWETFPDMILGAGYKKNSPSNSFDFFSVKAETTGTGCSSSDLNNPLNFIDGQLSISSFTYTLGEYSNVQVIPLTVSTFAGIVQDSMICISSNINDIASINNHVTIYPNPASEYLRLSGLPKGNFDIRIYNVLGRACLLYTIENNFESTEIEINVSQLPENLMYYLSVYNKLNNQLLLKSKVLK